MALTLALTLSLGCGESSEDKPAPAIAPPVAEFAATPTSGDAPLTVAFSNASEGANSYAWNFGDGTTSEEESPEHTYPSQGNYDVCLTATGEGGSNTSCLSDQQQQVLVDYTPVTACSFDTNPNPAQGYVPATVSFTAHTEGGVSFGWDFGDGHTTTTDQTTVSHIYQSPSAPQFAVTLKCIGEGGDAIRTDGSSQVCFHVQAHFETDVDEGIEPLEVQFNDLSLNAVEWRWDFGDGNTSSEQNPKHTYLHDADHYMARLSVRDACGGVDSVQHQIRVRPAVVAKLEIVTGPADNREYGPVAVTFTCKNSEHVASCDYDFGDGSTMNAVDPGQDVTHIFQAMDQEHTYNVVLTANGVSGDADTDVEQITVMDPRLGNNLSFEADPTSGFGPLEVTFSAITVRGDVTGYKWDFGDGREEQGQFSRTWHVEQVDDTLPEVVHNYTGVGPFDVSLTVFGQAFDGSDQVSDTEESYVKVHMMDPDFEYQQGADRILGDNDWDDDWGNDGGQLYQVADEDPDVDESDLGQMPSSEIQYALLSGAETPDGEVDVYGTSASFYFPEGLPVMQLDYSFINTEERAVADYNDLMGIVVYGAIDGDFSRVVVTGADSTDPYLSWSEAIANGRATPVQVATINLADQFPGATHETPFYLEVWLENSGVDETGDPDSQYPPYAEIDNVRFSESDEGLALAPTFNWNDDVDDNESIPDPFPIVGEAVHFRDTSSGEPTSWFWDFAIPRNENDSYGETYCFDAYDPTVDRESQGTGSADQDPSQCFSEVGEYKVSLIVRRGDATEQKVTQTVVISAAPTSEIDLEGGQSDYGVVDGGVNFEVSFVDNSTAYERGPFEGGTWSFSCDDQDRGSGAEICQPKDDVVMTGPGRYNLKTSFPTRGKYNVVLKVQPSGSGVEAVTSDAIAILAQKPFSPVFAQWTSCASGGCHNSGTAAGGLVLESEAASYDYLVSSHSTTPGCEEEWLVVSTAPGSGQLPQGDPLLSLLYVMVDPSMTPSWCFVPTEEVPDLVHAGMNLDTSLLESLNAWISDGAASKVGGY